MKKVCVIGGGASGLMAAYAAKEQGNEVILLEKNEKLGKKIYITGKGRCNFTNDCSPEEFLENVVHGKKFLTGAIYSFPPQKTIEFFENNGLIVKTERGNRVFPASDHASDVTKTLEKALKRIGVDIHLNEEVLDIIVSSMPDIGITPRIVKIITRNSTYDCDVVIVATGGVSYPATGSTGDGYKFAKKQGILVEKPVPALCGLNLKGDFYTPLQGLSLKNVSLSAEENGKIIYNELGEMLFTHFGISGPIVLSLSSLICRKDLKKIDLYLDFKPGLTIEMLDKRILRDFAENKNKAIQNALINLLPQKIIPIILGFSKIDPKKNVNIITKEERGNLVHTLKHFPLKATSLRDFSEAIITSGGVSLSEINPKDLSSKKIEGLKFCGEVLDVDAFTGGYNLQIAFALGYAAGRSIH